MRKMNLGSYNQAGDSNSRKTQEALTWRSDPEFNLSDWTVVVTTKASRSDVPVTGDRDGNKVADVETVPVEWSEVIYHVHKAILGIGPRSSEYFLNVFRNKNMSEFKSATSRLHLEESAGKAFPAMLDFMYNNSDVSATTETAVALRHLANYFGMPNLFESVNKFIENDMDKYNIHIYLDEAILYNDDIIMDATMSIAAENWNELFVSKDGQSVEKHAYLALLPQSKHMDLLQKTVLQAAKHQNEFKKYKNEFKKLKRLTDQYIDSASRTALASNMPKIGDFERAGRVLYEPELPLFYYEPDNST